MSSSWATHFDIIEDASRCPVFEPNVVPAISAQARRRESARSTVMIYRSKVDSTAPTVLITLTACFIAIGLIILIGTGLRRWAGSSSYSARRSCH